MAELRIRELVDPTVGTYREVAPDGRRRLEGDPFNFPGRRLEAFIRVLGRDARREDVLLDGPALCLCGYWRGVEVAASSGAHTLSRVTKVAPRRHRRGAMNVCGSYAIAATRAVAGLSVRE